jgi:restriction endonuclease S subunit
LREEYNARIAEADHRIQQLQRQLQLIRNSWFFYFDYQLIKEILKD